jgi:phospholipid-binding lipoprotein MlaA
MNLQRTIKAAHIAAFTALMTWSVGAAAVQAYDPLEPINRQVFAFNRTLDDYLLKPAATTYQKVVPNYFQDGVNNFFSNFRDVWSVTNLFLQGRGTDGLNGMLRIGVNSTFGLLGWLDIATEMGLYRQRQDFGQTLGRLGVGPGPYIVWPFFGPSTLRDSFDIPVLWYIAPEPFIEDIPLRNITWAVDIVRYRASLLSATNLLDDISLDPYTFVRDGYLQRRRSDIYDGEPPDEPETEDQSGSSGKQPTAQLQGALELQAWSTEASGGGGLMALRRGPQAAKDPAAADEPRAEVRSESRVQPVARVRSGWSAVASERPRETEFVPAP